MDDDRRMAKRKEEGTTRLPFSSCSRLAAKEGEKRKGKGTASGKGKREKEENARPAIPIISETGRCVERKEGKKKRKEKVPCLIQNHYAGKKRGRMRHARGPCTVYITSATHSPKGDKGKGKRKREIALQMFVRRDEKKKGGRRGRSDFFPRTVVNESV